MTPWNLRSAEERTLLNPAFLAILLWHAGRGYAAAATARPFLFHEAFLILPFILDRHTRELLPRSTRTSLPAWLEDNPLIRTRVLPRARLLVPFTKEAVLFGCGQGLLNLSASEIKADERWRRAIKQMLRSCTEEVAECATKAEFLAKWFSSAGSSQTIFVLLGLRP